MGNSGRTALNVATAGGRRLRFLLSWTSIAAAVALGGCTSGILDPQGPVGAAQRTILLNALAIMLAIVVPTIAATLGCAWWFREFEPKSAVSSGLGLFGTHRTGRMVDPDPRHPVSRWDHLDRFARARSCASPRVGGPAAECAGRLSRLEMAVHLPGPRRRERERARRPGADANLLRLDVGERHERIFRAAARQHDLHDERNDHTIEP